MKNNKNTFQDLTESTNIVFYKAEVIFSAVALLIVALMNRCSILINTALYNFLLGIFTALLLSGMLMFCVTRILVNRAQGNSGDVTALVIMEKKKYDEMIERISVLEKTIEDYEKGQESSDVLETKE